MAKSKAITQSGEWTIEHPVVLNWVKLARKAFPSLRASVITDEAIALALIKAKLNELNPFGGQVHLLPFRARDGSVTVAAHPSIDTLLTRARKANPNWTCHQSGLVIRKPSGEVVRQPGEIQKIDGTIIGAYTEVYYSNGRSSVFEVSRSQYRRQEEKWVASGQDVGFMLCKISLAHACRRNGAGIELYLVEEMPPAPPSAGINGVTEERPPAVATEFALDLTPVKEEFIEPVEGTKPVESPQPARKEEAIAEPEPSDVEVEEFAPQEPLPLLTTPKPAEPQESKLGPVGQALYKGLVKVIPDLQKLAKWGHDEKGREGYLIPVKVNNETTLRAISPEIFVDLWQAGNTRTAGLLVRYAEQFVASYEVESNED